MSLALKTHRLVGHTLGKGVRGFSAPGLPVWSAAVRDMKAGKRSARWIALGDSTTRGASELTANRWAKAWPTQAGDLATAAGIRCGKQSFFGGGGMSTSLFTANHDGRVVLSGSGWAISAAASRYSLGGEFFRAQAAGTLTFTPAENVDTIDVYTVTSDGNPLAQGAMTWALDGGATTVVSNVGADAFQKISISCGSLGAHSVTLTWSSGSAYDLGIHAYDGTQKRVDVFNGGIVGATTASYNTSPSAYPWAMFNALLYHAPDLITIMLGENDLLQSVAPATTTANLQALITAAKATGADVLMMTPIPIGNTATYPTATQDTYAQITRDLAASNNLPLLDIYTRWDSYAAKQPLGWYSDTNHPSSGPGYGDIAAAVASRIFGI